METSGSSAGWREPRFPFTAIVGQESVKRALVIGAIDPTIGGVLISGPKGSGKSLIVRSLSEILPNFEYQANCQFHCSAKDPSNMCPSCLPRYRSGEACRSAVAPMKVVQVPLSVTDDMLVGSLDLDRAVEEGVKTLRPGLLAEANQNILYIDEVNLLPDHITDSILDAAASGWNTVEREGISVQHPSRFVLVGTMNPEEGELRPQILDRFGVYAETKRIEDAELRAQVIARNEEFYTNPSSFVEKHSQELERLRAQIRRAKELLPSVEIPHEIFHAISQVCSRLRVDGSRPDITAAKAAKALVAFQGKTVVAREDVEPSLELALGHRTRQSGLAPPPTQTQIRSAFKKTAGRELKLGGALGIDGVKIALPVSMEALRRMMRNALRSLVITVIMAAAMALSLTFLIDTLRDALNPVPVTTMTLILESMLAVGLTLLLTFVSARFRRKSVVAAPVLDLSKITINAERSLLPHDGDAGIGGGGSVSKVQYGKGFTTATNFGMKILRPLSRLQEDTRVMKLAPRERPLRGGGYSSGRRAKIISSSSRGRYTWYQIPRGRPTDIAIVPTIRVAATQQMWRKRGLTRLVIEPRDLRVKVREYRAPYSIVLLVDMSMSMISSMDNLISAIYRLHGDVYRQRDRIGLVVFKGAQAFPIQHPTSNLELVVKKLREVGASDFTPMAAGLTQAWNVLKQERLRNRDAVPNLIVFSDGIVNVPLGRPLSHLTRRKYHSEAQADSFDAAHRIVKERFRVYVINTSHSPEEARFKGVVDDGWRLSLTPTQFLMELARVTKGTYYGMIQRERGATPFEGREEAPRWFYQRYSK